jgi:hypothetical protein
MVNKESDMQTKNETKAVPPLNVEELPGGRGVLRDLPPAARAALTQQILRFLADHPGLERSGIVAAAERLWADIRDVAYDVETGRTLGLALAAPSLPPPNLFLREVLAVFLAAGEAECVLLRTRDGIDAALARLRGEAAH